MIQIATKLDTLARDHAILVQEVAGIRVEQRNLDRTISTQGNEGENARASLTRLGERIGATEQAIAVIGADIDKFRNLTAEMGFTLRGLDARFLQLEQRDNEQAAQIRQLLEDRIKVLTAVLILSPLLAFVGPKLFDIVFPSPQYHQQQPQQQQ